ncbi:MAG: hypothetical protein GXX85_00840 [Ignavibacteria bacterium]|nr:hypothetical protein [Ignavibacteria bacterium]
MDKFLKTYKEIQVASRSKSIKVFSMTIIVVTLIVSFSIASVRMFSLAQKNTQILEHDGRVRAHSYINPDSANIIKCQAFMEEFSEHFFEFSPEAKDIEKKLTYALELGDNTLKTAYQWFLSKNWYSDIIGNNLKQTIKITKNHPVLQDNYFKVYFEGIVTLRELGGSGEMIHYNLKVTCFAVPHKPSYPQFKQGLFIENFRFDIKEMD